MIENKPTSQYWHYRFTIRGTTYRGSTGLSDKSAAQQWERKLREKLRQQSSAKGLVENFRDELTGGRRISLSEAFAVFREKPRARELRGHHAKVTESFWNDFLAFMAATDPEMRQVNDVTAEMAQAYISHLRRYGRFERQINYQRGSRRRRSVEYQNRNRALSPRTVNGFHKACQHIFGELADIAGLTENPFQKIPKLSLQTEHREPFTPEELRLIGEQADRFVYPLFRIGLSTGLRRGDICCLRWAEVDLDAGWIECKTRKTGKTVQIPIFPSLAAYLGGLPRSGEYVLPEHAEMYQKNAVGISRRVRTFLESMGIKTSRQVEGRDRQATIKDIHSLRHNFCFLAAQHGVPLNVIQGIVGHMDVGLTAMYADHFNRDQVRAATETLPDLLGPREPDTGEIEVPNLTVPATLLDQIGQILEMASTVDQKIELIRDILERG